MESSKMLFRADEIEYDETARWLRVRRGAFEIVCNFAARAQGVPCLGTTAELSTHDPPQIADGLAQLPSMSGAVIT